MHHGTHFGLEVLTYGALLAFFGLELAGKGGFHHIADGTDVVAGHPLP